MFASVPNVVFQTFSHLREQLYFTVLNDYVVGTRIWAPVFDAIYRPRSEIWRSECFMRAYRSAAKVYGVYVGQ